MAKKSMNPVRKVFRHFLYICLGLSVTFIGSVVYLRMNYHHLKENPELRHFIFRADVQQHKLKTYLVNDDDDLKIIQELFLRGPFSVIYREAALDMLEIKAIECFAPAQTLHADLILYYRHTSSPEKDALDYYERAAEQNYAPAIEKLSVLKSVGAPI